MSVRPVSRHHREPDDAPRLFWCSECQERVSGPEHTCKEEER